MSSVKNSRPASNGMKIGVMGAKGSFSEEAGRIYAEKHAQFSTYEIIYLISAENVLAELEKGNVDVGVFPIENSNGSIVIEAVHAMSKHNFDIKKMFEIDVHHNLLVRKGTGASEIDTVVSHDQAIKQCRMYLRKKWPNAKIDTYSDTATAAEDLASGKLPASYAVIASRNAAETYGLDILEESIQDLKFNYTVFIAAERLS